MLKFLVSLFHDTKLNSHGAQLIFSTHDTAILDQKYLRRDQVWFVDKKKDHSTKLYPLSDFSPRKDREDLSKNYLLGRYGALPYFKGVASAMGVESGQ
jgi:AAA15 family ATPase/GTPase